jgi:hypothetical protein
MVLSAVDKLTIVQEVIELATVDFVKGDMKG